MNNENIFTFTIGELKELLQQYPDNMPVVTSGYENGYENFYQPYIQKVIHFPENSFYDGQFQLDDQGIEVLIIEREERHD